MHGTILHILQTCKIGIVQCAVQHATQVHAEQKGLSRFDLFNQTPYQQWFNKVGRVLGSDYSSASALASYQFAYLLNATNCDLLWSLILSSDSYKFCTTSRKN